MELNEKVIAILIEKIEKLEADNEKKQAMLDAANAEIMRIKEMFGA